MLLGNRILGKRIVVSGWSLALLLSLSSLPAVAGEEPVAPPPQAEAPAVTVDAAKEVPAAPPVSTGQVYKTVDAQGKVIFTDAPSPDKPSELVKMPVTNAMPATSYSRQGGEGGEESPAATKYTKLTITSPVNDTALGQDVDLVQIEAVLEPGLMEGHVVRIIYDGKAVTEGLSYTVSGLERGTHTVEAKIFDAKGKLVKSSSPVKFHVRRISSLNKVSDASHQKGKTSGGLLSRLLGRGSANTSSAGSSGGYNSTAGTKGAGGFGGMGGAHSAGGAASAKDEPSVR